MKVTKEYRVTEKQLLGELSVIIKDEICAVFSEEKDFLQVKLLNGQKFSVSVKEIP